MAHISREELLKKLEEARAVVGVGETWIHTKTGGRYIIESVGIHEEEEAVQIGYRELDHEPAITWYRFFDIRDGWIVPTEIAGMPAPRFTKVE